MAEREAEGMLHYLKAAKIPRGGAKGEKEAEGPQHRTPRQEREKPRTGESGKWRITSVEPGAVHSPHAWLSPRDPN